MKNGTLLFLICVFLLLIRCERPCDNYKKYCTQLTMEDLKWIQLSPNKTFDSLMNLGHTSCYLDQDGFYYSALDTFYYILNNADTIVATSSWRFQSVYMWDECHSDQDDQAFLTISFPDEIDSIVRHVKGNLKRNRDSVLQGNLIVQAPYAIPFRLIRNGIINNNYYVDTFQISNTVYNNVYKYENIAYFYKSIYFKPNYGYLYIESQKGDKLKLIKKN